MLLTDRQLFEHCYNLIMGWETERYTNNKGDLGGPTKYGIILNTLSAWRKKKCTAKDVENLQKPEALDIYYHMFWIGNGCHRLPPALALVVYDGCVNQSASAIRKYLQMAVGVKVDGIIGPGTATAAGKANVRSTLMKFMALRAVRYSESSTLKTHGLGWYRRMFDMDQHARDLFTTQRKEN